MGKFSDACSRKPKHIRSKKNTLEEKKKLIIEKKTPSPEHATLPEPETGVAEPVVSKKPRVYRKKDSQKEKGVEIREVIPEASNFPLVPSGDKKKEV